MQMIRRLILALALSAGLAPAFAQVPAPVPALPDTERRTSYTISASTCACAVNFALYGDSTDYQNWIEVFLNGVRVNYSDPALGWTITSPSGSLATLARPITNAVLTFNTAQTGTVQIVGARRPRRTSQFSEGGVTGRALNQVITDIVAQNRETWDKTNDVTGRAVLAPPGETLALLPALASRQNQGACFDSGGNLATCVSVPSSTFIAGTGILFTGTNPTTISAPPFLTNNPVAVETCGAVGNGIVDDAPAIRACAAQVGAQSQGGTVGFSCNKTYLLGSKDPAGAGANILRPWSNVTYQGCGDSSVLKVGPGLNGVSTQFFVFYPPDSTGTYTYSNVAFRDFKIDFNPAGNGAGTLFWNNIGIGANFGNGFKIQGVTFSGNPGSQNIQIGNNSGVNYSNVLISGNKFLNSCDIVNSACTDHSSIFIVASNYSIANNLFAYSSQSIHSTAIEMHGFNGTAQGNSIQNYSKPLNIAALGHTANNLSYIGNTSISSQFGFELFFDGTSAMRNIVIANNTWRQSIQQASTPFFDFDSQVTAEGAADVIFSHNSFISDVAAGAASTVPTTKLGRIANLILSGNIFHNGLGPCIGNGTLGAATSVRIDNNTLIDCGQTSTAGSRRGILINSGTTIDSFGLSGNKIENVASVYMTTGIDVTLNTTYGFFTPNNVVNNVATPSSIGGSGLFLTLATNSLSGAVALNNTANFFDGPSIATGASGTWLATGTVALSDSAGAATFLCKLWDGTTVIASTTDFITSAGQSVSVSLSGLLISPAANIRISCKDTSSINGAIVATVGSGNTASTLTAFRTTQ